MNRSDQGGTAMGSDREGGDGVAIRAVDVRKVYGTKEAQVEALRGISIEIAGGERVALGQVGLGEVDFIEPARWSRPAQLGRTAGRRSGPPPTLGRQMARFRSTTVGMIFQSFNLIGSRSAVQNVELPMVFAGRSSRERLAAARVALEAVGLGARLNHRPAQMSGGESQRVAIARALVNRPRVILADEPTGNLDSQTARQVMALILDHVREHAATLVLVTHDEELAASCMDRIVRLVDGQIAAGAI